MDHEDPIAEITVKNHTVALPRPLQLGAWTVTDRTYAVAHVRTADGLVGSAYAQTRGAPIAAIIDDLLAPVLLGADSTAVERRWRDCFRSTVAVGRSGLVIRALSLLDIALWDIRGIRAGLPLYRLLGGTRDDAEVMFIAGYPARESDIDDVVRAAVRAAADGHRLVKIARSANPVITRTALDRLDRALPEGTRVVVDASWVWEDPTEALTEVRRWPASRVAWVEDPFPPEDIGSYARLRQQSPIPVGGGDELTDQHTYERLLEVSGLDVLRLDVATIGGVTAALRVARRAQDSEVPVSLHISPEVSAHLAAAMPAVICIETFDRSGNPYDPSHELCTGGPVFLGGHAVLPSTAGIGISLPE